MSRVLGPDFKVHEGGFREDFFKGVSFGRLRRESGG